MIPVLGVPILNRPELLDKLLASVDQPVERIVIIDNGNVIAPSEVNRSKAPCVTVVKPGHNIGVAASWNLIIKSTPQADWWLIVNSDLTFGPGSLEELARQVEPDRPAIYQMLGMAAFAITPLAIQRVGWFDENFHPAYCEDIDYHRRATLAGVPTIELPLPTTHVGSATIYGEQRYMIQNGRTYPQNVRYYERKWGGHMHGGETFSTPFGRGGDIRDTQLDVGRLRELAWKVEEA